MSAIIRCSSCNIVISELLCFIQNQLPFMDEDILVRLTIGAFTSDEITSAKDVLYSSLSSLIVASRREAHKDPNDIYAIISVFKRMAPHLPVFVARELYKLPPITFEHLNTAKLMKQIVALQNDVRALKRTAATKDELLYVKREIQHVTRVHVINLDQKKPQPNDKDKTVISFNA